MNTNLCHRGNQCDPTNTFCRRNGKTIVCSWAWKNTGRAGCGRVLSPASPQGTRPAGMNEEEIRE